jgi:hypothetical protein
LQAKVDARDDVTVVVCGDSQFAFSRSRQDLEGLDWRRIIPDSPEESGWRPRTLSEREQKALRSLCRELGVSWGRFDFLEDADGLVFLEYNANGQWAFLDFYNDNGLMRAVADYLSARPAAGNAGETVKSGRTRIAAPIESPSI